MHIMEGKHLLSNYQQKYNGEVVVIGDGSLLPASRCGGVTIDNIKFGEALHVPRLGANLHFIYNITHTNKR
jgi:hypothetical protein